MKQVKNPGFLEKLPDGSVVFTCPHAEIIVPMDYFEHNIADIVGREIDIFGLFNILVWNTPDIDEEKPKKYFYKFKSRIRMIPSSIEEGIDDEGKKQMILHFNEGAVFISTVHLQKDINVARTMLDIMTMGYLPAVIPYDEIAQYWTDVNIYNGVGLDTISQTSIEMIVSALCRDPRDPTVPFRHTLASYPQTNLHDWRIINIRTLPRYSDTFASLVAGDPRQNVVTMISKQRAGKKQKENPIEKVIL
jgi:hypothetical protein